MCWASKDGKKRFADTALAMSKAFTLCCTLDEAKAVREEVAFFQAVKVILTKREITQQKKTDEQRELAIRQIISSAVVSEEVVDIFDAVGLDKPNIGILDDAFLAEVRNLPERNLAVELLERLLEGEIKSRFAGNVVQNKKFSDCCRRHQRYQNRVHRNRAGDGRAGRDGQEVPRGRGARRATRPDRRRSALLRRAGQQRIGRARADRRDAEEDRPRTDREPAQEPHRRLVGARERARQAAADGQAHPAQVQVPAGPAGCGGGAGAAAGRGAGRGVGLQITATSEDDEIMGVRHRDLAGTATPLEGVQFHPESILSEHGHALLRNFIEMSSPR
jgi:hypothetical protein